MHRFIFYICLAAFSAGWGLTGNAHASAIDPEQNRFCLNCHSNPDLQPVTEKGQGKQLLISDRMYSQGVHKKMTCLECHPGQDGTDSFNHVPHSFKNEKTMGCLECHPSVFFKQTASFKQSNHYQKLGEKMTCTLCHDAHTMMPEDPEQGFLAGFYQDNTVCIGCHTDLVGFKQLSGRDVFSQDFSHSFLPFKDKHFETVRCVDCHTPVEQTDIHRVLAKDQSLKDCAVCHSENSFITTRFFAPPPSMDAIAGTYLGKGLFDDADLIKKISALPPAPTETPQEPDRVKRSGFVNDGIFADTYFIGAARDTLMDRTAARLLAAILAAVILHGVLRLVIVKKENTAPASADGRVYGWSIRYIHWMNVILFLILIPTGFSMHFGGKSGSLPFSLSVDLHHLAAVLLVINYFIFVLTGLVTGSMKSYLPLFSGSPARIARQLKYYLYGIFVGHPHPFSADRDNRFNPLQKAVYLPLMYLAMPLLILSGAGIFFAEITPETIFGLPGKWLITTLHFGLAVLFTAFAIGHIYLGTTGEKPSSLYRDMFLGRRRKTPDQKKS